jgi:molybdopterin/thiamine biosynthesis adenylyltransferase
MKMKPKPKYHVAAGRGVPTVPFPMCFTKPALEQLLQTVGTLPPETGAKGFGPSDRIGFDIVEFDDTGSAGATCVVYSPNAEWGGQRQAFHLNQPAESMRLWTGDIHSHPGDFGSPSQKSGKGLGDLGYVEEVFASNESMQWFLLPIFTRTGMDEVTIHPWVIERAKNGGPPKVYIADVQVCEVSEFPMRQFNPAWEASLTAQPAELSETQKQIAIYTSRTTGIVSPNFRKKVIAAVGVGAGSYMIEKITRLSPGLVKICDPDRVEVANLSRTAYTYKDAQAGKFKVDALADRLNQVNPFVRVDCYPHKLDELTLKERREFFGGVDLIIAGTDDFHCQALCNEMATLLAIPAVFIGIHVGGNGGRIAWYLPDVTPCYRCIAHERFAAAAAGEKEVNLTAAHGSVIDTQFIDMIAAKVAVAILDRGNDSASGRFFSIMKNRHEVVCRCSPEYEWGNAMWEALLGDLPTTPKDFAAELKQQVLLAMDTIWLQSQREPQCPVCGTPHKPN